MIRDEIRLQRDAELYQAQERLEEYTKYKNTIHVHLMQTYQQKEVFMRLLSDDNDSMLNDKTKGYHLKIAELRALQQNIREQFNDAESEMQLLTKDIEAISSEIALI